jgi:tRNA(fMet)-specific endonuclease VapC
MVLLRQIEKIGSQGICTSIIVASELRYGCAKKGSIKLITRVEELLKLFPVLPLDISAGDEYGGIRFELEAAGQPIGMNDLAHKNHQPKP